MPVEYYFYILLYAIWIAIVFKNLRVSILLLPLFFPMYLMKFDVFGIPIYFIEGLILISAIPLFIGKLSGHYELNDKNLPGKVIHTFKVLVAPKKQPIINFLKSYSLPVVLFLLACSIAVLTAKGDSSALHSLGILKSWVIVPIVYFYILMSAVRDKKDINFSMYSYLGSAIFLSLWGLFQAITKQYITIDDRVSGPFESANYLAIYLAPALIFASVRFIQTFLMSSFHPAGKRWNILERRVFISFAVAIIFMALVLSQSYGGILGVFVVLLIYIVFERFRANAKQIKKFFNRILLAILLIIIIGGGMAASLNSEKFQNLTRFDEHTSVATRLEIWQVGGHLIKENPLFGIGLGMYQENYNLRAEEILQRKPLEETRLHSHNVFMETWLNAGLLGLVSFVWLIVLAYFQILKVKNKEDKLMLYAGIAMLTYIVVHGLIDVTFWKNDLALIFWLIMGVIFSLKKDDV
ncbi:O-antigen ligase family protein [Patescibacteria group bacterium]